MNTIIKARWIWVVFALGLIGFILFYLFPFFYGIYGSMSDILDGNRFVFLQNYKGLFQNSLFFTALKNTIVFTLLSLGLIFVFSFGMAYLLTFTKLGRGIPKSLLFLPLSIPAVSVSFVWLWLFHYKGWLSGLLHLLFGTTTVNMLSGTALYIPLLLLYLWKYAGFGIFIYAAGLRSLPKGQLDAFALESRSRLRLILRVLLPHELPRTVYILLLNLIFSMNIFREIYAVWKDYPPKQLYMIQHFIYNNFQKLQYERASAGAYILAALVLLLLYGLLRLERRAGDV